MDETETILKPETKTERRLITTGYCVQDKGSGWPISIQNALFTNVSTHPCADRECPDAPLWIEGRNEQCSGVAFGPNVTLQDSRVRWAVSLMGTLAEINGTLTVHKPPVACVANPYPNVSLVVACGQ
jgi:hypothetical protein